MQLFVLYGSIENDVAFSRALGLVEKLLITIRNSFGNLFFWLSSINFVAVTKSFSFQLTNYEILAVLVSFIYTIYSNIE